MFTILNGFHIINSASNGAPTPGFEAFSGPQETGSALKHVSLVLEPDPDDPTSIQFRIPKEKAGTTHDRIAFYVSGSGKVGVGTKDPETAFDVRDLSEDEREDLAREKKVLFQASRTDAEQVLSGSLIGNAKTATQLQTAREIGGTAFDGSADIEVALANTATTLQTARNIGGVSFNGSANINLPGVNTAGNQNTSGNAATATKLAATKTIGGVAFDGSSNIVPNTINVTTDTADASHFITYVDGSSTQQLKVANGLTYNPGTNTLSGCNITLGEQALDVRAGSIALSAAQNLAIVQGANSNIDIGAFELRAATLESDVATGTAPFTVASTTEVANLHAQTASTASFATNFTASGNISASGTIVGDNIETLFFGSFKVTNGTAQRYAVPGNQGISNTAWGFFNANGADDYGAGSAHIGFIVPFDCTLIGFRARVRHDLATDFNFAVYYASATDMDGAIGGAAGMGTVTWNKIENASVTVGSTGKHYNHNKLDAQIELSAGDHLVPALFNGHASSTATSFGSYTIFCKRR